MRKGIWLLLGVVLSTTMACSLFDQLLPSNISNAGSSGSAGQTGSGGSAGSNVLFSDSFGDSGSGWEVGQYDNGSVGYQGGTYAVVSDGNGATMWGAANQTFTDVDIQVDATEVKAPANSNNDYGVVCRLQSNGDGYYLLISGDGLYSIQKGANDSYNALVDWTDSSAINQGDVHNSLRAVCQGSNLTLYVNGQQVANATDSEFTSGDLGLTATSYESDPTEVHFDNLVVSQP